MADQLVYQSAAGGGGVPDLAEVGDRFGEVMKSGDFNCDNIDDLAVGVPTEDANTGAVVVTYGTSSGLNFATAVRLTGTSAGDLFGTALAVGDFSGDSCDDLAVGIPGRAAGALERYDGSTSFGSSPPVNPATALSGLTDIGRVLATQTSTIFGGADSLLFTAESGPDRELHRFSSPTWPSSTRVTVLHCDVGSLVSGNFTGVPNVTVFGCPDEANGGNVYLNYYWDGLGLPTPAPLSTAVISTVVGDRKGASLAVGQFDNDIYDDLVIGSPGRHTGKGAVVVCYGSSTGTRCGGGQGQVFTQNKPGVPRSADLGDHFGSSVLAVDWNLDGFDDVAVGIPDEDSGGLTNNGLIQTFLSNGTSLTASLAFGEQAFLPFQRQSLAQFGYSMTAGDFNGNGFPDVAISAPGATVNAAAQAGVVHAIIR